MGTAASTAFPSPRIPLGGAERETASSFSLRKLKADYAIERELATGGFSVVYLLRARHLPGKLEAPGEESPPRYERLALKKVIAATKEAEVEALNEIRVHSLLGGDKPVSSYIAALLEYRVKSSPVNRANLEFMLFFPFFSYGSLSSYLLTRTASEDILSDREVIRVMSCLASALEASHSRQVAHLDVKPLNLMLTSDRRAEMEVVLIDWGSAYVADDPAGEDGLVMRAREKVLHHQDRADRLSSAPYRAPELWSSSSSSTTTTTALDLRACDVYAFGCCLYAVAFATSPGYSPFEHPTQGFSAYAARTATYTVSPVVAASRSGELRRLMEDCLALDPARRPHARVIAERLEAMTKRGGDDDEDFEVSFPAPASPPS